jgi:sensor c-di-GMP phosphodiesterase-like protein
VKASGRVKRRTRKTLGFAVGAGVLALVPVFGSLAYTYRTAIDRADAKIGEIARQVAEHVHEVLWSAEGALADLSYFARAGCTPELIREFRNKAAALYATRGFGYIDADGYLTCTSFGKLDRPVKTRDLKLVIKPEGSLVWFTPPVETEFNPGVSIIALHNLRNGGWIDVLFPPELLVSTLPPDPLGAGGFVRVSMQGIDLATLGTRPAATEDVLSTTTDVGLFDAEVTATATRSWALRDWRRNLMLNGIAGGIAGVVLVAGAAHLAGRRSSLTDELKDALDNQEFEVYYQPVVDLQDDRCVGAEALIRWRHPERGLVPPDLFIALAEETGAIIPMTRWIMRRVGEDMGPLLRANPDFHIAINLAPAHFANLDVVADAKQAAEAYGIEPARLLFEVTERGLVDDAGCRRVIEALGELGSEVAIDDFGTGYSSLAYVEKFHLDYLKIDKAFVSTIGTEAASAGLAAIIIDMARQLGLRIIAEGVETEAQMTYLRDHGVSNAQGWYFSKPLPAADFLEYARRYNAPPPAGAA